MHGDMAQREKRSVSIPPDLAHRIEEEAAREGTTFSGWLTDTATKRLKLEAGRRAVEEFEREHGPITPEERLEARRRIDAAFGRTRTRRRKTA